MQAPRVNPVGVVEIPPGYASSPRPPALRVRLAAAGILLAFVSVIAVTTALSAGRYCLTSSAGGPSPLHSPQPPAR